MSPFRSSPLVSRSSVRVRATLALLCCAAAALASGVGAAPASAAQRIEEFPLPSTQGNIDVKTVKLNRLTELKATVMLPDGYDEDPGRRWPVVYLLQGIGDHSEAWAWPGTGNVAALAKGLPAIVVMPEGGRGFFTDWWRGGKRSGPNWQRYYLDEVLPTIESRYRILPGRRNHAIAGVSMGGYGALQLAGALPGYFGTAVSMSGLLDSQSIENWVLMPSQIGARSYESIWGRVNSAYATVSNPTKTVGNVASTRIYLSVGDGIPDPKFGFNWPAWTNGAAIEYFARIETRNYSRVLARYGIDRTIVYRHGVHDWPYWRRELPIVLDWNLFAAPPENDGTWEYATMAPHGNAWGLGYRFAAPPTAIATFERKGQELTITGKGTVTITPGASEADASGAGTRSDCAFTAELPVTRTLPAGC